MDPNKPERDFEQNNASNRKLKRYLKESLDNELNAEEVAKKQKSVWQKIDATLDQQEKKKKIDFVLLGLAASISLLIGFSVWLFLLFPKESEMETLAGQWSIDEQKETQLILSEEETVFMEDEESVIEYNRGGSIAVNTRISDNKKVDAFNSLIVPYGKRSKLILEDGTKVWINSGSKLIYPAKFGEKMREIFIEGEAYFEVSEDKNRPFIVQTKDMDIKVLGTEFNITAYANTEKASAVLVHGSIELNVNKNSLFNQKKLKLKPNERALYNVSGNSLIVKEVDPEYYVSWKDGYMKFNNSKLQTIIERMEKHYDVAISLKDSDLLNKTFTGKLDLKQDIEEVINIICATTSLTYTKTERRYLLEKK